MGNLARRAALLGFCFAALAGNAAAQVLNMSHDLTTLGIASQNMTPNNPALDSRPLFQAALNYIQGHTVQTLTVDAGNYYLLSATQGNAVVIAGNLSNLTIDLAGSTIFFKGPQLPNGIQLFYCTNVTLKNFQIDFVNPPYTHVQLVSVDAANRILHYQTLSGWPDPSTLYNVSNQSAVEAYWAAFFRNGTIVPATTRTLLQPIAQSGQAPFANSTISVPAASPNGDPCSNCESLSALEPGDTIVVTARGGGPPILVWECNGITISNVDIYGSAETAIQVFQSSNSILDTVSNIPRPGTGLIGSAGDSLHFTQSGPNNHIRNSHVARTMDDGLVMETEYVATVVSQPAQNQLSVTRAGYVRFPNGTLLNFLDPATQQSMTAGVILSQNPPDNTSPASSVTLTFDRNLPSLALGTVLVFGAANQLGQGSTIEDNIVEDTYGGHGVWLAGDNGVTVQRNVVRRTGAAGIASLTGRNLFPPSLNLSITDNALEVSLGPQFSGGGESGAIMVKSVTPPNFIGSVPTNSNITIANNYTADSTRSGIWIGELNGGTLQNNLVIRYSQNPTLGGTWGIDAQDLNQVMQDALVPVVIHYSSAVAEIGDTISATSPITAPVTMTPPSAAWPEAGGAGSFNLQTAVSGFGWNAVSDSSWLTITSPVPGAGSGTVQYSVAANNTGASRSGNITIAGVLFPVLQTTLTTPVLAITKTHTGSFVRGQMGATYTLTVSNQAGAVPTSGVVTVSDTLPVGLTLVSMAGSGWTCTGPSCNRSDSLAGGASYPPITVTVNVAANASSPQVNQAIVSGGGSASAAASDSTVIGSPSALSLSLSTLKFGYSGQQITGAQTVALNFNPSAAISWTASSSQSNITVSPTSGTGSAVLQVTAAPGASGMITVTAGGATNSPQQIQVNVTNVAAGLPYGSFDTPVNNTTGIAGAIPVTGWALDNIQATNVGIWREPVVGETAQPNGLVFIGDAVFVAGARPDVQATYPNSPFNYRGGWGYMLLTNFLPNASGSGASGNGTYKLHAIITNASGQNLDLGAHSITVDNVHASKPFGTIDTPAQGGTVSGNAYVNFGWALTQNPYAIPIDGSTITVILDGVAVGHPTYNQFRSDIANLFPGLANSNGAIGFFFIDTTTLANGVHTISWNVFDNAGRGDGIGSRYFTVANTGTGSNVPATDELIEPAQITADVTGVYSVSMEELDRIELPVGATHGYLLMKDERRPLPVGSTLKGGRFYWQAGPGFLGDYDMLFERAGSTMIRVHVNIKPKSYATQESR